MTTHLDTLPFLEATVGYGAPGIGGDLGYEGKRVSVGGQPYSHALSAHPPGRLLFRLDGRFAHFCCAVALNDDVPARRSHADFRVLADGREIGAARHVTAGERPRPLRADVARAQTIELLTETSRWEHCHAVWLDPLLAEDAADLPPATLADCLGRAEIELPSARLAAERCVASVASPGFADLLDDMLGSLAANGGCHDALLVVFAIDADAECLRVAAKYGATVVRCRSLARLNSTSKALLYSLPHIVDARQFVCLDADMLVLGDLRPVLAALDACPEGSIMACREGNGYGFRNIGHAYESVYWGTRADWTRVFGATAEEAAYPLVVNDGLFAAGRAALLALDGTIRAMPRAAEWVDQRRDNWWRNQLVFNLALARLRCGVELDPAYNIQLNAQEARLYEEGGRLRAEWGGRPARVLHFNGLGRNKYPEWRGRFARVAEPLRRAGGGDGYDAFLVALRAWVGRHGMPALAWSFYGTPDACSAHVADTDTFPLLALLHYLVRANGCVRVLETGTARGVSAACLASAVAHRPGGRVVTFDPASYPERADLWAALPAQMRACIDERAAGALEGMAAELAAGASYDAVLLDSLHDEEHVWAEFQLAARLVCRGGLVLIHDARLAGSTVAAALRRIEAAGYCVARLWSAECGVPEDNGLGLALITLEPRAEGALRVERERP